MGGDLEAEQAAYGRVQAVGGDEVTGPLAVDQHVVRRVAHRPHRLGHHVHAGARHRLRQGGVQGRTAHAAARPRPEDRLGGRAGTGPGQVADAAERMTLGMHAEGGELGHGARHQPLAAGLVDRPGARLAHHHVEARAGGVQRDGEADRPAAGHDEVTHR